MITIFTPTYNRADTLMDTYKSLCNQTCKKFIWLIIDDGSVDNTEKLVSEWKKENLIEIEYVKKENGGKYSAYNLAMDIVKTEYIMVSLDSDDMLTEDAVEFCLDSLKQNPDKDGIVTLWKNLDVEKIKQLDLKKLDNVTLSDALKQNMIDIELNFVFKTDKIKNIKYPKLKKDKFFTEAYINYQLDLNMIWTNKISKYGRYLSDGYSLNYLSLFKKYPESWYHYNKLRFSLTNNFKLKCKYCIYMISFGLLSKTKHIVNQSANKLLTILLFPFGILGAIYLKVKK